MAFYGQYPAIYAYPMPYPPTQEFIMYDPNDYSHPLYYEPPMTTEGFSVRKGKQGYNNRKESSDSGVSSLSSHSRKVSTASTASNYSNYHDDSLGDYFKESSDSDTPKEDEAPYFSPDDELCEKIVAQVEFYFSDANISKDKFLLKHVKRNKEGFVSLKLISSFKRVKHLTKDWRQVAEAVERKSDRLQVNDLKTKVRRFAELPEYDETVPSRTVVALNLPLERPTIEGVAEIFSKAGDIVLIRILRPGNPIPADIKPFVNKHPEMTSQVCALIEFEKTEYALRAVRDLCLSEDDKQEDSHNKSESTTGETEKKLRVMELISPAIKNHKKEVRRKVEKAHSLPGPVRRSSYSGYGLPSSSSSSSSGGQMMMMMNHHHTNRDSSAYSAPRTRRISLYHNMKFSTIDENPKNHGLNPNAPTFTMQQQQQQRRHNVPPPPLSLPPSSSHTLIHPLEMMAMTSNCLPTGSWMSRRIYGNEVSSSGLSLPTNVLRMPKGPNKGSKGFNNWCKNRMTATEVELKESEKPENKNSFSDSVSSELLKEKEIEKVENVEKVEDVEKEPEVKIEDDDEGFSDPEPEVSKKTHSENESSESIQTETERTR